MYRATDEQRLLLTVYIGNINTKRPLNAAERTDILNMYITKIKMKPSCFNSYSLEEIDQVYLEGYSDPGYWYKADVYDFLHQYPGSIQVGVPPYPAVIPAVSIRGEKYVKSAPNGYGFDNLLSLPRE